MAEHVLSLLLAVAYKFELTEPSLVRSCAIESGTTFNASLLDDFYIFHPLRFEGDFRYSFSFL